jgi:hypothetical protein
LELDSDKLGAGFDFDDSFGEFGAGLNFDFAFDESRA